MKKREKTYCICIFYIILYHTIISLTRGKLLSFLHVFQSQLGLDILKKNVFVFDCKTLRCSQRELFLPLLYSERFFDRYLLPGTPKSGPRSFLARCRLVVGALAWTSIPHLAILLVNVNRFHERPVVVPKSHCWEYVLSY